MNKEKPIASHSLEGLKEAKKMHIERMNRGEAHPASGDGFMLSAMQWAIAELQKNVPPKV